MQNGTLGERSPNHHGMNGRFWGFNGCHKDRAAHIAARKAIQLWAHSLSVRVGPHSTCIFWSILRRKVPNTAHGTSFAPCAVLDWHKEGPLMAKSATKGPQGSRYVPLRDSTLLNTLKNARRQRGYPLRLVRCPRACSSDRRCWQIPSPRHPFARGPQALYPTASNRRASWHRGRPNPPGPCRQYW